MNKQLIYRLYLVPVVGKVSPSRVYLPLRQVSIVIIAPPLLQTFDLSSINGM